MDIITHSQGGSCAVTQTECCALIVDESASISSHLLNHTRTQVNTLSDPTPGLVDLNQWSDHGALDREKSYLLGNHCLNPFSLACTYIVPVASAASVAREQPNQPPSF